ncbi:MAG: division/cell wall cluster transcriptional repressor MraZ [Burkholderiales bacterium]|nr:division/cell wall cluster transcriptional repressor MraZ [Burkholderiales bacterium]
MFQGAAALNMDAKGRIAVPTRHREALTREAGGRLVLTAHPEGCLLLYPGHAWEPVRTKVMGFPSFNTLASKWKRLLVGFAEDVELDSAGRVLVSPELRNFARLDKRVMMVGQGSHFEIWAVEAWEQQLAEITAEPGQALPPGMEDFAL